MPTEDPVVLVVDDEEGLADLYSQWLTDDYTVRTAYDGEQALELLDEHVDVVLLDRRMPDLSGDEVLDRIRDRGYNSRVAMVTAVQPDYDIIELGFDDYVTKPVSKADLYSVVDELLTRATYNETLQQYYAAVSTRAALDAEKSASELTADPRFAELTAEIDALESELDQAQAELEPEDFEAAFRDLGREDNE